MNFKFYNILLLKGYNIFVEDFLFFHLSTNVLWMNMDRVDAKQVINGYYSRSVLVELSECLQNDLLSFLVEFSSNSNQKLVDVDTSISIFVKVVEQLAGFSFINIDSVLSESYEELFSVDFSVTIVWVKNSKCSSKSIKILTNFII